MLRRDLGQVKNLLPTLHDTLMSDKHVGNHRYLSKSEKREV